MDQRRYPSDPGGNFATDAHRRVFTGVPHPDQELVNPDEANPNGTYAGQDTDSIVKWYTKSSTDVLPLSGEEILHILEDLEADGDITRNENGWVSTEQGQEVGNGPTAADGGRNYYE